MSEHNPVLAWLELEYRLLKCQRPVEAAFLALNMGHALTPYRQAALWNAEDGVIALSGAATVESGSPYVLWLAQVFQAWRTKTGLVGAADLPDALAEQWADWLPAYGLILHNGPEALLFARDVPYGENDAALLERLADLTIVSRRALTPKRLRLKLPSGREKWGLAAAGVLISLFPVTSSVLAPAEAVPAHPVLVRAPLDGVVDKIQVVPNQNVAEGDALFRLDDTTLSGKLNVARQEQATAEAEYRQATQAMVFDPKARAQVAILAGKAEEKAAEVQLLDSQLARIQVKAPRGGVAVFDDPAEWVGKPVSVGEKVMAVADAADTEVDCWASPADVGDIHAGSKLTLFLNTAPLSPVRAVVQSVAYEAVARPDATIAHRVRAVVDPGQDKPRLGLKGTARISGETVPLMWWLFRRPLGTIRQYIGF